MKLLLIKFWNGDITLWKSYWIVGELLNSLVIIIIFNIELKFYNNLLFFQKIPYMSFNNLHLTSKFLVIIWSFYITVGIWRAAEKYKGKFIWIALTLIVLSYRVYALRLLLY